MRPSKSAMELREAMYNAGKSDSEIAKVTGMKKSSIRSWRRRNSLPGNEALISKPLTDEQKAMRQVLYGEGKSDNEIARAIHASKSGVTGWRNSLNLPPNGKSFQEMQLKKDKAVPELPPQYDGIEAMLDLFEQNKSSEIREAARTLVRKMFMQYVDSRLFPEEQKETPADGGV